MFLERFLEIAWVASAFKGIRVAVGLLILDVGIKMIRKMPKEPLRIVLMIAALAAMLLAGFMGWKLSTIVLLLCAAVVSLAVFLAQDHLKQKAGDQE